MPLPPLSRTKPSNSFLRMRKEICFLYTFTDNIYAIMNPEVLNAVEHSVVVMSHATGIE